MSQLLKKEAEWNWTIECQGAFDAVKQGLTEASVLAVADQDRGVRRIRLCDRMRIDAARSRGA
ncbi:hypothetical protein V7S43_018971 [Phytophthora oleae]|uniref:Reverse transcriptase/retrotransposon-derived protein RNase H-like domain-containing protein n=1 Tax=Phytophthora oleae TaxID=2107226 RepID=A0ABD3EP63_9STRA